MSNAAQALATPVRLDIRPVAGRIGAEIRGVTLSGELDAATVEAIQAALVRHKVIFFRDQSHLDDQTQEAFAHLLGEPVAHPPCRPAKAPASSSSWMAPKAAGPIPGIPT